MLLQIPLIIFKFIIEQIVILTPPLSKSTLRKTVLSYRRLLPSQEYEKRNFKLRQKIENFVFSDEYKSVHLFLPIKRNKEVDVFPLLQKLWENDITTFTSITDFKNKRLYDCIIDKNTAWVENKVAIPEPITDTREEKQPIDLYLIPLLLSDKLGNRIGYGGGYYDRHLQQTKGIKVGLSLSPPLDRLIQIDSWDIPLNFLITPYKTYNYG